MGFDLGSADDLTTIALSDSLFSAAEKASNASAAAIARAAAAQGGGASPTRRGAGGAARDRLLSNADVAAIAAADIRAMFKLDEARAWGAGGGGGGGARKIVLRATIAGASIARGEYAHVQYTIAVNARGSIRGGASGGGASGVEEGRASVLAVGGLDDSRASASVSVPHGRGGSTEMSWTVTRRYSRFKALHQWLLHHFPGVPLPLLPKTSWRRSFNAQYIEAQRAGPFFCSFFLLLCSRFHILLFALLVSYLLQGSTRTSGASSRWRSAASPAAPR